MFESMLLMRDGYITPVEVRVDAEQRRVFSDIFPNGAKTRCNQEEKENKLKLMATRAKYLQPG